jgi:peptide/nickel transport system substrate-binding protein
MTPKNEQNEGERRVTSGFRRPLTRRTLLKRSVASGLMLPVVSTGVGIRRTAAASAPGATRATTARTKARRGGSLSIGVDYDTTLFDPLRGTTSPRGAVAIYEALVIRDDAGSYQPWLAESWEASPDQREYTFTLREGMTFHDGTPLDANAVKWFYDTARDPNGGYAYRTTLEVIGDITVVDDRTVKFTFTGPFAAFLEFISVNEFAGMVSPKAYQEAGENFGITTVVGSGPFVLDSWTPNDVMIVKRRDDYWWAPSAKAVNPGPAYLDEIVYRFLPEEGARVAALESGQFDILYATPARDYERLKASGNYQFFTPPRYGGALFYIWFNLTRQPFGDVNVRRALNHAVDREGIELAVFQGITGKAAYGYLPPHFAAHYPDAKAIGYPYDPEKAKRLLDEAGYTVGPNGVRTKDGKELSFDLIAWTWPEISAGAQAVAANLKEIGVRVTIQQLELSAAVDVARAMNYDLWAGLWGWGNPTVLDSYFPSNAAFNFTGLNDPQLDELFRAAAAANDIEERDARYREIDRYLIEQAYWIPIAFETDLVTVRNRVNGFTFNQFGDPSFPTDWWVED